MTFSKKQKDILLGCLLGDANLQTETDGRTWRLRMLHSIKQTEYLAHKYNEFKQFCSTGLVLDTPKPDKRTGKTYSRYYFNTQVIPSLKYYGDMFYSRHVCQKASKDLDSVSKTNVSKTNSENEASETNKTETEIVFVKKVPLNIEKLLTARALAYWFMDDGALKAKNSQGVRICSEGFTFEENQRLRNALTSKFGLTVTLNKQREGYRLYISSSSYHILKDLIFQELHESLKYKFPRSNEVNEVDEVAS
jgi:hypothetical protein